MSCKSFRHILFGLSIAAVAIGLGELPARAGTENSAIVGSEASSSSAFGSEPIAISASTSPNASAGDRVAATTILPDLAQPNAPEATQSAFLTQQMLLAQSTAQPAQTTPAPLPPRPATPYQTNPDTNPDATSPRPTVPDTAAPSAVPPGANSPEISPAQTLPEQTPSSPTNPTPRSPSSTPSPTYPNPSAPPPIEPGAPTPSPSAPPLTEPITPEPSPAPSTPGTDRTPPGTFNPDTNNVSPGRATRSGSSYIGIGGNIGLGSGNTALGEGSFSVFSKVGLTSNVSVRPNVLVSDDPTILLPLTLDFTPRITGASESLSADIGRRISPFIGAGIAISTGNDGAVDFLGTAGVDVPISRQFTATASVNATLFDNPAVGLLLGIGYNF